jgi:uncharacterized membrane protein YhdT
MAQCPNCNGSGRVLSHLNPHDVNKVGAGMGMHRCARCNGQGVIDGASGNSGGQEFGNGLLGIILALFLHPAFSFVGFWLIGFGLLLAMAPVLGVSSKGLSDLPNWYGFSAMGVPVVLAVLFRRIVPVLMKWILILGSTVLAIWLIVDLVSFLRNR